MPTQSISFGQPYQDDREAINRRLKMAEALQAQSLQPIQSSRPDAPLSWTQGLAKMLQAYGARQDINKAEADQKSLTREAEDRRSADISVLIDKLGGRKAQPAGLTEDASGNVTQRDAITAQTPMESLRGAMPMIRDPQVQSAALGMYLPLAQQQAQREQLAAAFPQPQQQAQAPQGNPMIPGPNASVMAGSGSTVPQAPSGQQPQQNAPQGFGSPAMGIPAQVWLQSDPTGQSYIKALAHQAEVIGSPQPDQNGRMYVMTKGGQPIYLPNISARDKLSFQNIGGQTIGVNEYTGQRTGQPIEHTLTPEAQYRIPIEQSRHFWETGQNPPRLGEPSAPAQPAPQPRPQPAPQPGPAPLTPKDAAELAAQRAKDQPAAQRRLQSARTKAQIVAGKVDEAIGRLDKWLNLGTTGPRGALLSNVPGTDAYDLGQALDTIKANLGFQELQAMREASPTGGALGQVAVQELEYLQNSVASLKQGQDEQTLRKNLLAVKRHFEGWRNAVEQSYASQYGGQQPQGQPQPAPQQPNVVDFRSLNPGR